MTAVVTMQRFLPFRKTRLEHLPAEAVAWRKRVIRQISPRCMRAMQSPAKTMERRQLSSIKKWGAGVAFFSLCQSNPLDV